MILSEVNGRYEIIYTDACGSWKLETVKARVRISLQSMRVPCWGLLSPVERPPVERVGDSEDQSESQFAVSENILLGTAVSSWESWWQWRPEWEPVCSQWERPAGDCCLQLSGLQLRELETVTATVRASLQSVRTPRWELLLSAASGWATLAEKQKKY